MNTKNLKQRLAELKQEVLRDYTENDLIDALNTTTNEGQTPSLKVGDKLRFNHEDDYVWTVAEIKGGKVKLTNPGRAPKSVDWLKLHQTLDDEGAVKLTESGEDFERRLELAKALGQATAIIDNLIAIANDNEKNLGWAQKQDVRRAEEFVKEHRFK